MIFMWLVWKFAGVAWNGTQSYPVWAWALRQPARSWACGWAGSCPHAENSKSPSDGRTRRHRGATSWRGPPPTEPLSPDWSAGPALLLPWQRFPTMDSTRDRGVRGRRIADKSCRTKDDESEKRETGEEQKASEKNKQNTISEEKKTSIGYSDQMWSRKQDLEYK